MGHNQATDRRNKIDALLNHYFPERDTSFVSRLVEDESDALLAAMVMELRENVGNRGLRSTLQGRAVRLQDLAHPDDVLVAVNEEWESDGNGYSLLSFDGDLGPGDTEDVVKVYSTDAGVGVAARALGTTRHVADLDGDDKPESVVKYVYQYTDTTGDDNWQTMNGPSGTSRVGSIESPQEMLPGDLVGPVCRFRIRLENRTDDSSLTDTTVSQDELGGRLHGCKVFLD